MSLPRRGSGSGPAEPSGDDIDVDATPQTAAAFEARIPEQPEPVRPTDDEPPALDAADYTDTDEDFGDEDREAESLDDASETDASETVDGDTAVDDDPIEAQDVEPEDVEEPEPTPLPEDVVRLQSELVQGAVRREQRIAEITAAVAQAISKAHREVNQSASELDSLRSMLQGVASADESQSFLEIERVQTTIQATQAEWSDLAQQQEELKVERARLQKLVAEREAALEAGEAGRVSLETERNDAERRAQELFDRLSEATAANSELKSRLDDLVAAEDVTAKLETKIRDLTAEKATVVHRAKTDEAALQGRLDQALDKLAAAQQAHADDKLATVDPEMAASLERAQADAIKMQAELDMVQAELAKTKAELDQAYVAETELETKLQSAWTAADEATSDQQNAASDQQRLLRDLSDTNQNLEKLRGRLDKAAGERKEALDAAAAEHAAAVEALQAEHATALEAAQAEQAAALEAAQAETRATLDKQARDHQAGVAALKAAHKKKLHRHGEELQEKSTAVVEKLRNEQSKLEEQLAAADKLKKDHADELAKRDAEADRLRQTHSRELDSKAADTERLERAHAAQLESQTAETEAIEARLKKLQSSHDDLVTEQKKFNDDRKEIKARTQEIEQLQSKLDAAESRSIEREAELEKLRLSSDDTHQRIGTLLGQIETLQATADAQTTHVEELGRRESELEAEVAELNKQATNAIEARSKVIKGAESTALLASQAETRAEQLDRELQQASVERDAVTGALTTAEARIVNLEAELDRITTLADQRVQAAFESATALGERAIADAEAKEQRIQELEAQLSLLQHRGSSVS